MYDMLLGGVLLGEGWGRILTSPPARSRVNFELGSTKQNNYERGEIPRYRNNLNYNYTYFVSVNHIRQCQRFTHIIQANSVNAWDFYYIFLVVSVKIILQECCSRTILCTVRHTGIRKTHHNRLMLHILAGLIQLIQWLIYPLVWGGDCLFLLLRKSKAKTEPHPGLSSSTSVCFTCRVKVLGFTSGWLVGVEVKCWVSSGVRLETCK